MDMKNLPALRAAPLDDPIRDLARAHRRANGLIMSLSNRLGTGLEGQLSVLPQGVQDQIEQVVIAVLTGAHHVAGYADLGRRGSNMAVMASGAVGGSGGLVTALAELPVTITVILQAIRREARLAGFDPNEPGISAACLQVFAAASPLSDDDGVNTAFFSARLTITGPAVHKVIATIAPRLAAALGPKIAAQSIPILGAATGAVLNTAYLGYYREMARIRFALMRLAEEQGGEAVITAFATAVQNKV